MFNGVVSVKLVSDSLARITVLSLDAGPPGTIGLAENNTGAQIRLPAGFQPRDFDMPDPDSKVTLQDSVQCWYEYTGVQPVVPPISVVKTGTTKEDFVISMDMTGQQQDSGRLEIYVRFH